MQLVKQVKSIISLVMRNKLQNIRLTKSTFDSCQVFGILGMFPLNGIIPDVKHNYFKNGFNIIMVSNRK